MDKDIFLQDEPSFGKPLGQGLAEDDDYPLYDSVASDEDLVLAEQQTILAQQVTMHMTYNFH